ncbi:MAG: SIMPL domain-containing protein [Chitinophagaceae bacterium]|nr:SIMPL domain-containing protein [Chitinophagaceae bacterium]HCT22190.1 SIMPL domain-containing protein [Chitinophagaceae bacterium]
MKLSGNQLVIAAAIIISSTILAFAYKYKFRSTETIVVTGLAEKDFTSDQIVWKGSFNRYGMELKQAYASLKSDEAEIRNYLKSKGIPDSNIVFSSVDVQKSFDTRYDAQGRATGTFFTGYTLSGEVTVNAKDIVLVENVSRQVTELLQRGIEFNSRKPDYYYTRLNELKIDLLAKASQDARQRAETIAKNSGIGLGNLKKASMGVFQITGKNNNEEYSYGGSFNTTSKEKTASITLRVEYLAD